MGIWMLNRELNLGGRWDYIVQDVCWCYELRGHIFCVSYRWGICVQEFEKWRFYFLSQHVLSPDYLAMCMIICWAFGPFLLFLNNWCHVLIWLNGPTTDAHPWSLPSTLRYLPDDSLCKLLWLNHFPYLADLPLHVLYALTKHLVPIGRGFTISIYLLIESFVLSTLLAQVQSFKLILLKPAESLVLRKKW